MTDIINEVSTTEPVPPTEYEQPNSLTTPVEPETKAQRAPSRSPSMRKPQVIDPEVAVIPSLDEVQAEATLPIDEAKADAKVECPDCGEMMSQKTLRHFHGPNCMVKKRKQAIREREVQNVTDYEVQRRL